MDKVVGGLIVNTHGLKGELKVSCEDFDIFNVGDSISIEYGKEVLDFNISKLRVHKNHLLVTLEGYEDINLIEKYKGCKILVEKGEDVFYSDLIGYKVYTSKEVGTVKDIISNGAQDILVTNNNDMIPYIDEFVAKIDHEEKIIYILEIEGLINEI